MQKQSINETIATTNPKIDGNTKNQPRYKFLEKNCLDFGGNVLKQITYNENKVLGDKQNIISSDGDCEASLQEDLLFEHKELMEKLLKLNQVFLIPYTSNQQQQMQIQKHSGIFKQITLQNYLHITLAKLRLVKPSLIKNFASYLRGQKHFYRFLQHLYYSYSHKIVHKIFKYIFYSWQLYYPCIGLNLDLQQSISMSNRISNRIYKKQSASMLNPCRRYMGSLQELIKGVATTVVLVMEKHFINPLLQSQIGALIELMI